MSNQSAIRIENLSKQFGWREKKRVHAVKNLNMEVTAGQVYGFLGPNGAGKTTTIRMILDLIRPNTGDVYLFGQHVRREHAVLGRVGSLVEGAYFYNFLSGRDNLKVCADTSNLDLPESRYGEVLELVDMRDRAHRRVNGYSTGMKQRLGIAAAMLTNPDLVILDEPANGLDPQGIAEMRALIRKLADEHGKTVFLSSHQLGEVEQACDRVAIINTGELLREGTVIDLLSQEAQFRIRAEPLTKATAIIAAQWTYSANDNKSILINVRLEDAHIIVKKLVDNDIRVHEASPHRQTLEEYFLAITNGENQHVV